jgi:4-alpha-glucanotransferase
VITRPRGMLELTRLYGVETTYEDMNGEKCEANADALLVILRALGAQLERSADVRHALRARRAELEQLPIQPVHVAWDGRLPKIGLRLAHSERAPVSLQLALEDGESSIRAYTAEPVSGRGRAWKPTHEVGTATIVPLGYHRLRIEVNGASLETLIISAPRRAYLPDNVREWGVFIPLYALCSQASDGIGDYDDLHALAAWVGELGGGFISTLPLLATFLDMPFEPSPYAPASRLFWNELFIAVSAVPGAVRTTDDARKLRCRPGELVDYAAAAAHKRRRLEAALRATADDAVVSAQLREFVARRPRLEDYARFRAVCDRRGEGWPVWPARLRDGVLKAEDYSADDMRYHLFAQWQADSQLGAVAAAGGEGAAALYLDMPLGVHSDSYDVWRFRELFAEGVSAGAPPDPLFTGGQDWGFRPLRPDALRTSGYSYLVESFRHHLRHASMLRLDHVMSLYRLFWVPAGMSATDGVYVRYPDDELFAVLVLESARHQAVVVGEDLGTVPAAVRRAMDRHGVQRMHVVQFEASPEDEPPVPPPPPNVVASLNTHDMPTFAGFWRGSEIDDQLDLGLIDHAEHEAQLRARAQLRVSLSRAVGGGGEIDTAVARQRLLERLAASAAHYVMVNLEDLWLEDRPQNVPGTSDERPNWRRRAARDLPAITTDGAIRRMLNSIAERRRTPPTPQ